MSEKKFFLWFGRTSTILYKKVYNRFPWKLFLYEKCIAFNKLAHLSEENPGNPNAHKGAGRQFLLQFTESTSSLSILDN